MPNREHIKIKKYALRWNSIQIVMLSADFVPYFCVFILSMLKMFVYYSVYFSRECIAKFGDSMGEQIWEAVNECFDNMPIAATVDNKVKCLIKI